MDANTSAGMRHASFQAPELNFARIPRPLHRTSAMTSTSSNTHSAIRVSDVQGIVAANELLQCVLARQDAQIHAEQNTGGQGIHEQVARLAHSLQDTQTSVKSLETTVSAQSENIQEILRILRERGRRSEI